MGAADEGAVMDIADLRTAITWQAEHAGKSAAPNTARVIRGLLAILDTDTALARRMNGWDGPSLRDAMPLRVAAGLHHLVLTGADRQLEPVYEGLVTDQAAVDAIVAGLAVRFDARLLPWLEHPPQTNEAGRSAGIMAGLLWLAGRLGPKFELTEIGASAGINTMMDRYTYDLGGRQAGPGDSRVRIAPEWRGPPPPDNSVEIVAIRGCDLRPVDLADPAQALRLKAYIWPDARDRLVRMDAAIALAARRPPDLVRADAAEFVRECLAAPQPEGATRALFHTVVWQYLPDATQSAITGMMEQAGSHATRERPIAWLSLETDRATFQHELHVRWWGGEGAQQSEPVLLARAHPHGAWIDWLAEAGAIAG